MLCQYSFCRMLYIVFVGCYRYPVYKLYVGHFTVLYCVFIVFIGSYHWVAGLHSVDNLPYDILCNNQSQSIEIVLEGMFIIKKISFKEFICWNHLI